MNKYLIVLIVLVAFVSVVITGYLLFRSNTQKKPTLSQTVQNNQNFSSVKANQKNIKLEVIILTNTGFNPQTLSIKTGESVVWQNNSGTTGAVNSDNYPTNLLHPFLNFGQFNDGSSFSTIFTKPGTYTYYNYLSQNQSQKGTIIVE